MSDVPHTPINTTIHVKSHARLLLLRIALLCWAVILVFLLAGELVLVWAFSSHQADSMTWAILAFAAIYLDGLSGFFLVRTILRYRAWKRFEQQRQEAANGRSTLLAAEQPAPDIAALSLPTTIEYRPPWSQMNFPRLIILLVLTVSLPFIFIISMPPSSAIAETVGIGLVLGLIFLFVAFNNFWVMYGRDRKNIQVTEEGIRVSGPFVRTRFLAWKDMRLMTILHPQSNKIRYRQALHQLEIAGEKQIVSWPWIQQTTSSITYFNDPADIPQRYAQNVRNLLAVISAKTGLALYDLREK